MTTDPNLVKESLHDAEEHMKKTITAFELDLRAYRTGRASPAIVEHLHVNYYDTPTPLYFGPHKFVSQQGLQQGDACGTLLFCLGILSVQLLDHLFVRGAAASAPAAALGVKGAEESFACT